MILEDDMRLYIVLLFLGTIIAVCPHPFLSLCVTLVSWALMIMPHLCHPDHTEYRIDVSGVFFFNVREGVRTNKCNLVCSIEIC